MKFDRRLPYDLWLDSVDDAPASERPTFTFRRINGREFRKFILFLECDGKLANECASVVYDALRTGLSDWRNQSDPDTGKAVSFEPDRLEDIIDPVDASHLMIKRLRHVAPHMFETKKEVVTVDG